MAENPVVIFPGLVECREEVDWFARQMEVVLQANDHKSGWEGLSKKYLIDKLEEEYEELIEAVQKGDATTIATEAADLANVAMMLADLGWRGFGEEESDAS